jgi:hypothetical protein
MSNFQKIGISHRPSRLDNRRNNFLRLLDALVKGEYLGSVIVVYVELTFEQSH